jgi:hypothetical protein
LGRLVSAFEVRRQSPAYNAVLEELVLFFKHETRISFLDKAGAKRL